MTTRKDSDDPAAQIQGFALSSDMRVREMTAQMRGAGIQATQLGRAAEIIAQMRKDKAKVILTFTTNLVTSGLRETFAQLVRERRVDCIITSIGSIEEDLMKTLVPFEQGSFDADDWQLHEQGRNRVGNIIIPNEAYIQLEKRLMPFFEREYQKQKKRGRLLAPHEIIRDLGLEIKDENSILHWAAKNSVPIFCPAPTDGAFGLQLYFFKQKRPDFGIDVSGDLKPLGQIILDAPKMGGILLGGGVAKHHAIGCNLLREGFDYAVYVSTGTPFDGSLSGARVNEAVSWGKVSEKAQIVHVEADATIVFPLLAVGMLGDE